MTDMRNKYNGTDVKWIHAQRINGGEWAIRFLSLMDSCPDINNSRMLDETAIGEMNQSEFAIFRNRVDWWAKKPYQLIDLRDKSNQPIPASMGMWLVNQADAGYF